MAGSKINMQQKVEASTILEVVVSMVIIMIVFGTAMMIYSNVLRLSLPARKIRAQAVLEDQLLKTEQLKANTSESTTVDDLRIEQQITPFENEPKLNIITLTAYDDNQQQIAQLSKVIVNYNEQN